MRVKYTVKVCCGLGGHSYSEFNCFQTRPNASVPNSHYELGISESWSPDSPLRLESSIVLINLCWRWRRRWASIFMLSLVCRRTPFWKKVLHDTTGSCCPSSSRYVRDCQWAQGILRWRLDLLRLNWLNVSPEKFGHCQCININSKVV